MADAPRDEPTYRPVLTLPEELLLARRSFVARPPRNDRGDEANRPLAAAQLAELVLRDRLTIESERKYLFPRKVVIKDASPTGDPLLDDALRRLAEKEARPIASALRCLQRGAEKAYWDRLVSRGVLRPTGNDGGEYVADVGAVVGLRERIHRLLDRPAEADLRDVALAALIVPTQSLWGLMHEGEVPRLLELPGGLMEQHRLDRSASRALATYERAGEAGDSDLMAFRAIQQIARHLG